jgi:hypothetical protein
MLPLCILWCWGFGESSEARRRDPCARQLTRLLVTIVQSSPGKYLNSRPIQRKMSCPGGTFRNFIKSYLKTLSLFYDDMPEVKISDNEMIVNFSHTRRTYTLV